MWLLLLCKPASSSLMLNAHDLTLINACRFSVLTQDHRCIFNFFTAGIRTFVRARAVWRGQTGRPVARRRTQARAALLQMSCGQRRVQLHTTGSGHVAAWIRYSFPGPGRGTPRCYIARVFGYWGKRGGGGRGRWGGPYEVPVSAPGPVPGGRQCQPFVFVPLTEGVAAPSPPHWASSMGIPRGTGISLMGRQELL